MKSPTAVVNGTNPSGSSKIDGTGFNILLVGYLDGGSPLSYGAFTVFWSSSVNNAMTVWRRRFDNSNNSGVHRVSINKYMLYSVRCKKL